MSRPDITSRPHPAKRARRVVGVTSLATTIGIVGGIAASQRSSSAEEVAGAQAQQSTLSTLTQTTPSQTMLNQTMLNQTTVLPTTSATPVTTTETPTTTTTSIKRPGDNPFGENGALAGLDDIVTPTTTTTTAAPRPAATAPPATNPPAPPTTVSNGS